MSRIEGVETIDVPTVMLELALKRGRVAFCWRLICQWAKPQCAGANLQSLFPGDVTVELPLQVIAPLFLSRKSPPNGRTVDLPDEVPDLFAKPQAPLQQRAVLESAQTNPPPPRESQALTASVPQERRNDMSPPHQSRRCGNSLSLSPHHPVPSEEHSGGGKLPEHVNHPSAPSQPQAHGVAAGAGGRLCALRSAVAETEPIEDPKDLVRRARELPGVEGVALASPDGLLLASHLPSNLDREAVAAFLPRLFAQAFDFAWPFEVRPSDHVVYSFQEATIALLRVNGFLLAAAGPPSQTMPLGQLRHLARRMRPGAPAAR